MSNASDEKPNAADGTPDEVTPAGEADYAIVTGPTDDAKGARILRVRGQTLQAGEIRPLVGGAPLGEDAEVVRLKPTAASNVPIFEVESVYKRSASRPRSKKGPAQVATSEYRSHWDSVFTRKAEGAPN